MQLGTAPYGGAAAQGGGAVGSRKIPLHEKILRELEGLRTNPPEGINTVPRPDDQERHFQVLITDAARNLVADFDLLLDHEFPFSAPQIRLPAGLLVRPWVNTVTGIVDVPGMQEKPWVASQGVYKSELSDVLTQMRVRR